MAAVNPNSRDLQRFHALERDLWRLFALFGDLCGRCARKTLREHASGERAARDQWCCCMIDNQVHDHWESLNPVQRRFDRGWYEKLSPLALGRMPGNGPCPALGPQGCRLKRCRPVTCTTQLCSKMLRVLQRVGLYEGGSASARQIEELIELPNILHALSGAVRLGGKVSEAEVARYRDQVRAFHERFAAVPEADRQAAIDAVLPDDGEGEETEPCESA